MRKNILAAAMAIAMGLGVLADYSPAQAAALSGAQINALREQNGGRLATEEKIIYTTAPVVPFTFTGFTRERALTHVLNALAETESKATFFVDGRDISRYKANVDKIVAAGMELGISFVPKEGDSFENICAQINYMQDRLEQYYGVRPKLIKQPYGEVGDLMREAASAMGCHLLGNIMNIVHTQDKDVASAEELLPKVFGKSVYSVGRGWVINIRTDYYTNEDLAGDAFLYIKRKKVDNIAYNACGDLYGTNPQNDSAYKVGTVGSILAQTEKLWKFPVQEQDYVAPAPKPLLPENVSDEEFLQEVRRRYIGSPDVDENDRMLGFEAETVKYFDKLGTIKTDEPVVFFTFDDWGTDAPINRLLYVLRKHNVKCTFFIITRNVLRNPNLLRAIAADGHTIASHSNDHRPMAVRDENGNQVPTMNDEEYYWDLHTSYDRLLQITGDASYNNKPVLTELFRPPTLAVSRMGMKALFDNGFTYVVNGSTSTEDYEAPGTEVLIKRLTDGLYKNGKVRKGACIVMHMSDGAQYTAVAMDKILTENEKRADGDPAKFKVGRLEDYLKDGYSQEAPETQRKKNEMRRRLGWWNG